VEEVAEANNYLAVRNDKDEYYLNGHFFIQWSGDYAAAGTVIHYKRVGNKESFVVPGPLNERLHIMVSSRPLSEYVIYSTFKLNSLIVFNKSF